jgi:DNA polymerase bacteriophage-type
VPSVARASVSPLVLKPKGGAAIPLQSVRRNHAAKSDKSRLWVDLETRSRVPIHLGTVKYATGVEVIILAYAIDDGPVTIIDMLHPELADIQALEKFKILARRARELWAHNAEFDRTVLETCEWYRKLLIHPTKWRCTAALSRMHGLPGGLEKLSVIFKLPLGEAKTEGGKSYIDIFCKPRSDGLYNDRTTHPKEWREFLAYGGQDVVAMRIVYKKTPHWNATPRMWAFWHLDQRMNARGVAIDGRLADAIIKATTRAKAQLARRTAKLSKINKLGLEETEGAVERTTQRARLLAYLAEFGVALPDLTADTVARRLEDESIPEHLKELLRIRQQASKASTAKCKRATDHAVNGRLYNLLVFCGAMRTGRWAGRTLQPQNLPRPKHKPWEIELAIELFYSDSIDFLNPDDVMGLSASCLRGLIIAGEGRKLISADLANIEGRFMAWIAGETWKLEAYAAYDRKEGPDTYKVSYATAFNIDPESIADEGDWRRQVGKVMELALQYYGGVGALCSMAETYGLDLNDLARAAWPILADAVKARARRLWTTAVKQRRTYGLEERVWLVCQCLVLLWRDRHPAIVAFWETLDSCCKAAIANPGRIYRAGEHIRVDRKGNWLRIRLPSGRYLNYPAPRVRAKANGWVDRSFIGVDPYTKQWKRLGTYSGKDGENICQGGCADILMDGLLAADMDGYNPVLSVHDEGICDSPDEDRYTAEGLSRHLVESSWWASGMPLAAKGKVSQRYAKG